MLCQEFRKIQQLALEQQVVWKSHKGLPRGKRNPIETEGSVDCVAVDNDRMFSCLCGPYSCRQSHRHTHRRWRHRTYSLYPHAEAFGTEFLVSTAAVICSNARSQFPISPPCPLWDTNHNREEPTHIMALTVTVEVIKVWQMVTDQRRSPCSGIDGHVVFPKL